MHGRRGLELVRVRNWHVPLGFEGGLTGERAGKVQKSECPATGWHCLGQCEGLG